MLKIQCSSKSVLNAIMSKALIYVAMVLTKGSSYFIQYASITDSLEKDNVLNQHFHQFSLSKRSKIAFSKSSSDP